MEEYLRIRGIVVRFPAGARYVNCSRPCTKLSLCTDKRA